MADFAASVKFFLMPLFTRREAGARAAIGSRGRLRWMWGLIILAFYTFQALLYVPQTYLFNIGANPSFTLLKAIVATFVPFYIYALLIPAVIWLGMRFPLERRVWFKHLLFHLPCSLAFASLHLVFLGVANSIILSRVMPPGTYRLPVSAVGLILGFGAGSMLQYWNAVIASQAINYFFKYREREFRLAQAELSALKMQLHPHFLFNTLNAISELVYSDPKVADQSILRLSDMLRFALDSGKAQEVTLKEEAEFLEKYVEIQRTLMRERLTVRVNIDPETLDASVPNMLLQPLVENAIKHGLAPRPEGGVIDIHARRLDGKLYLEVSDNGLGMPEDRDVTKEGVGLINTRERLKYLYGEAHTFNLSSFPGRGVTIRIVIPFKEREPELNDSDADY
ncbi:MAG TPA: sensor histidine kinase [Pyrinomonadaceae bacterium]